MKKKIFLVISAMLVFGLAIVVYSSGTATDTSTVAASCCCCHGDSCPMKNKDASGKAAASTHEGCDCCEGDSCPMMKKDADGKPMKMDAASCPMMKKDAASATTAKTEGEVSCPMMKKDADGKPMKMDHTGSMSGMNHDMKKHDMKMHGESCDCPCCHKAKDAEKKDVPAV